MPRRTRTESMRRRDAYLRELREDELATLRLVLRREWREYVKSATPQGAEKK